MATDILSIDFGTSNSAAAVAAGNGVYRIPIEQGAETLPTAVFFPVQGAMRIGSSAGAALIAGEEGRYMRALKSVLGLPLLHEPRVLGGVRRTLADVITVFLSEVKTRAETATGLTFRRALSGRPVHFHTAAPDKDAQAEADLRACYAAAGFDEVSFLPEPEAAAVACHGMGGGAGLGLIVDIGGGTSDFTVFRGGAGGAEILASHGIRLGGTDFDHAVSMTHAMPMLGLGGELRREMGSGLLPVPRAPYVDLATWAKIPFLYSADTRRMVAGMVRTAVDRPAMERFAEVLDLELGHELAFAVERGKIGANGEGGAGRIAMGFIEPGLSVAVTGDSLNEALTENRAALRAAASETLALAEVSPSDIGRVILVGGSSLMRFVSDEVSDLCPDAAVLRSEAFTAVVDGLALAAR
ncbi:Hsp70 family protein [Psychromarinibacter halotolerans]|uniref:Hsp70 family protein n=1 Tax=Psychromarinibacter halotolerans TaxID=1775175 RepID=A0ABV7GYS5_9RHOB|nr:Hsp70 family protein [Psychromarinibacter halotolerans]MDF0596098.1 Hsp70 family protein [Psychromarinibacter halotolerans]